jgi:hypothetical protein
VYTLVEVSVLPIRKQSRAQGQAETGFPLFNVPEWVYNTKLIETLQTVSRFPGLYPRYAGTRDKGVQVQQEGERVSPRSAAAHSGMKIYKVLANERCCQGLRVLRGYRSGCHVKKTVPAVRELKWKGGEGEGNRFLAGGDRDRKIVQRMVLWKIKGLIGKRRELTER